MDELLGVFDKLGDKIGRRVMRKAVNAGANPIVKEARALVPRRTGLLRKSIGKRVRTYKPRTVIAIIGIRKGFATPTANPRKYAHLVEFGTQRTRAKPFLRPAVKSQAHAAFAVMRSKAESEMAKEVAKLGKSR